MSLQGHVKVPKNKHHFVPQFYLRNFAVGKGAICLINIATRKAVSEASIKDECYRRKFYGKTDDVEDALKQVETAIAPVIKRVIDGESIPRRSTMHVELLYFVALQKLRTRAITENMAQALSLPMTYVAREQSNCMGEDVNNIHVIAEPNVFQLLSMVDDYTDLLTDLDIRIIRSSSGARFITSDSPVVFYNQWCEGVKGVGVLGTACGGLQIFFPLSPYCMLMLFDEVIYNVSSYNPSEIITDSRDIYMLNRLQTVFAQDNLYFSDWRDKDRIMNALPNFADLRQEYRPTLHVAGSEPGTSELLHMYIQMPDVNLKLRFSSIRRRTDKIPIYSRPLYHRHMLLTLNSPALPERVQERLKNKQFALKSVETWPKDLGNIVP